MLSTIEEVIGEEVIVLVPSVIGSTFVSAYVIGSLSIC